MARVIVFNSISVDGYFSGPNGDLSWAHRAPDSEWDSYVSDNASGEGILLFGRVTYEMMASFWPTPQAEQINPEVAKGMNAKKKLVFSRTLEGANWSNTEVVKADLLAEVRKLRQESPTDIVILGSGTIVSQLTEARLVDEYQMVVVPVILGKGRTMFEGLSRLQQLKRTNSRAFKNGNVLACYRPVA